MILPWKCFQVIHQTTMHHSLCSSKRILSLMSQWHCNALIDSCLLTVFNSILQLFRDREHVVPTYQQSLWFARFEEKMKRQTASSDIISCLAFLQWIRMRSMSQFTRSLYTGFINYQLAGVCQAMGFNHSGEHHGSGL